MFEPFDEFMLRPSERKAYLKRLQMQQERDANKFSNWLESEFARILRGEVKYPKKAEYIIRFLFSDEGSDVFYDMYDSILEGSSAKYYIEEIEELADPVNSEKNIDNFIEKWFDDYKLEEFYEFIKKEEEKLSKEGLSEKNFKNRIFAKEKYLINTKNDYGKNKKWERF